MNRFDAVLLKTKLDLATCVVCCIPHSILLQHWINIVQFCNNILQILRVICQKKGSMWRCLKMSHRIERKNRQILTANPSKNEHFFKNQFPKRDPPFPLRFEASFFCADERTDGATFRFAKLHPPFTLRFWSPFWILFSSMEHFYKHRSLRSRWKNTVQKENEPVICWTFESTRAGVFATDWKYETLCKPGKVPPGDNSLGKTSPRKKRLSLRFKF